MSLGVILLFNFFVILLSFVRGYIKEVRTLYIIYSDQN